MKNAKNPLVNFFYEHATIIILFLLIDVSLAFYFYSTKLNITNFPLISENRHLPAKTVFISPENESVATKKTPKSQIVRVPILMYHYVEMNKDKNDTLRTSLAVTPYYFEKQIQTLLANGYSIVSFRDLKKAIEGERQLPRKPIILTFDDGYRDFYTDAFPILKKYQVPATNFVIVNHIGRSGNLTKEMITEMVNSKLVNIGAHTLTHRGLTSLSANAARQEIEESKKKLEEMFFIKVEDFAYPYGFYNKAVEKMVEAAGYETAVVTILGKTENKDNLFNLPRIKVGNYAEKQFLTKIEKQVK